MAEQARFDVLHTKRLAEQRVRLEVDLGHGEVIRGGPGRDQRIHVDPGSRRGQGAHDRHRTRAWRSAWLRAGYGVDDPVSRNVSEYPLPGLFTRSHGRASRTRILRTRS